MTICVMHNNGLESNKYKLEMVDCSDKCFILCVYIPLVLCSVFIHWRHLRTDLIGSIAGK